MHILKAFGVCDHAALPKGPIILYDLQQRGAGGGEGDPRRAVPFKTQRCISAAQCVLAWVASFLLAEVLEVAKGPLFLLPGVWLGCDAGMGGGGHVAREQVRGNRFLSPLYARVGWGGGLCGEGGR